MGLQPLQDKVNRQKRNFTAGKKENVHSRLENQHSFEWSANVYKKYINCTFKDHDFENIVDEKDDVEYSENPEKKQEIKQEIKQVFLKGYKANGKIIRYAQVVVIK